MSCNKTLRELIVRSIIFLLFIINAPSLLANSFSFQSSILKQERTVTVSLPQSYAETGARFPVVYVLDGHWYHNLVDTTIREANRFAPLLPDFIVVSIHNPERWQDFTTQTSSKIDKAMFEGPYHANKFRHYLKQELIPWVEKNYRVNKHRVAFGFSLAGGFLADTLLQQPDLFKHYIMISPYLRWNHDVFVKSAGKVSQHIKQHKLNLYLSIGGDEDKDTRQPALAFYKASDLKNQLIFQDFEHENHTSMPHASVYGAFKSLYQNWYPKRALSVAMNGIEHLDYFASQHQQLFGYSRIQFQVYSALLRWYGHEKTQKKLLCERFEADYNQVHPECAP